MPDAKPMGAARARTSRPQLPYDPLAHNAYVAMLAERALRSEKGYLARRGFLERLIRLSRDMACSEPGALFGGPTFPRTWDELEAVAKRRRRWAVRRQLPWAQRQPLEDTPHQRWLTTGQAAKRLGVSPRSVVAWCEAGALAHERLPSGHRRLHLATVESWLQAQAAKAQLDLPALEARFKEACAAPDQDPPPPRRRR